MTSFDPIFAATEAKYNLPPGILKATAQVETHFNPKAISPQGAEGLMQLMPATANGLSVDPHDVPQAIDGAGRLWAQNLKASGGDIDRAAMMYHGGPDTRQWGPKTHAYPAKLAAALGPSAQPQQGGGDPIEAALSGQSEAPAPSSPAPPSAPADPNDPIESALAGSSGQDRTAEIASAQGQAAQLLRAGKEKEALDLLSQHQIQLAPGELDAFHAGKRSPGFNHVDQLPTPTPQTDQGLGFYQGAMKPIDNAATWLQEGAAKVGLDKPINALGNALGLPTNEQAIAGHKAYVSGQEAQGHVPGKLGEFAGEVAGTIPLALATKNPWIAGAGSGALTTDDPNNLNNVVRDAAIGAVGGKLAHAVTGVAAGVIAPKVSQAVQKLGDLGVQMTPGQIIGGALRRLEDGATSFPGLGDMVKNAQRRSVLSLNTGVINSRVLAPIGQTLPKGAVGREAVDFADNAVSNEYDKLLPQLHVQADQQFIQNSGQILQRINELPPERATQVQNIIKNNLLGKFDPAGQMSGTTFQAGDAKLGQLARLYGGSPDPEQRAMGGIFRDVQGEFRDLLERSNPNRAGELKPIRQAFANLVRVEGAAGSAGAKGGVFTPSQLASAVKRFDPSVRKKGYATGKALLQDVSDPANDVLPPTLADSGSGYRGILAYMVGRGGVPLEAAPAAIPLALYTKTGQKAFQKVVLAPRGPGAKALANGLSRLKTPAAIAGGQFASETANGR